MKYRRGASSRAFTILLEPVAEKCLLLSEEASFFHFLPAFRPSQVQLCLTIVIIP